MRSALMAGQAVLEELPAWLGHVQKMGVVCKEIFREVELASGGAVTCQGQGLMWGGIFDDPQPERRQAAAAILKRHCVGDGGVWPCAPMHAHLHTRNGIRPVFLLNMLLTCLRFTYEAYLI